MIANIFKKQVIQTIIGKTYSGYLSNQQCWIGLLKEAPVDSPTAAAYPTYAEVTGTGYARSFLNEYNSGSVDTDKISIKIEDGKIIAKNDDTIFIAECEEANWDTATYFGLFSAKTDGNLMAWGQILDSEGQAASITPTAGQIPVIRKDQLKITLE